LCANAIAVVLSGTCAIARSMSVRRENCRGIRRRIRRANQRDRRLTAVNEMRLVHEHGAEIRGAQRALDLVPTAYTS